MTTTDPPIAPESDDWARFSELTGIPVDQLQTGYQAAVASADDSVTVTQGAVSTEGHCTTKHADVDFFKVLSLNAKATFCKPSSDKWTLKLELELEMFGNEVWHDTLHLDQDGGGWSRTVHVPFAKVELKVEIHGSHHCLKMSGEACYHTFHWNCTNFDKQLFCFG